jgi:excisionase family DNA binding protein
MQSSARDVADSSDSAKLVRVQDAARELTLSVRMVWRLIAQGELETVRFGRAVRVKRSSIDALLSRGGTGHDGGMEGERGSAQ